MTFEQQNKNIFFEVARVHLVFPIIEYNDLAGGTTV